MPKAVSRLRAACAKLPGRLFMIVGALELVSPALNLPPILEVIKSRRAISASRHALAAGAAARAASGRAAQPGR